MNYAHLDWEAVTEKARGMTDAALRGAIKDCVDAGEASWELEKAGNRVSKTQGYYHDEVSVYRLEIKIRAGRDQALGL